MNNIYKIAKINMMTDTDEIYFNNILKEYLTDETDYDMYVKIEVLDKIDVPEILEISRPKLKVSKENNRTAAYYFNDDGCYGAIKFDPEYSDCVLLLQKDATYDILNYEGIGYLLLGMLFNYKLTYYTGLSLHGSCIKFDDDAIIFTAPSGVGKSTQANLWRQKFNDRVSFINDDKPALRFENGQLISYGTPFSGKDHINKNDFANVKAIINVVRGEKNNMELLGKKESLALMLEEIARSMLNCNANHNIFSTIEHILACTPIYKLTCTNSLDAVDAAYKTIYGGK